MKRANLFSGGMALMLAAAPAQAITIDGVADLAYGQALALQNVQTGFGDSTTGDIGNANGSELDSGYGVVISNTLYLVMAGNLEANFNKMEIFIDSRPGGQHQLRGDNPAVDNNGLNRMGYSDITQPGLKFETDFDADFWIGVTGGGAPYAFYANYAELLTDSGNTNGYFLGATSAGSDGTLSSGYNPFGIRATINNSNTAGVPGGTNYPSYGLIFLGASGAGVATGVELAIPLAAIGNPTGSVKVTALINGMEHQFLSNQFLDGGLLSFCCPKPPPNLPNAGEPRNVDLSAISHRQYFEVFVSCNPGYLAWTSSTATVRESAATNQSTTLSLVIARTGGICQAVSALAVSSNLSAIAGQDYFSVSSVVFFAQGATAATVNVFTQGDATPESPESFALSLVNPSGGAVISQPSTVMVTIRDDDSDADGLSDDYEYFYFGTNTTASGASDYDNDGINNFEENCAGTSPANSNQYLKAELTIQDDTGITTITWPSTAGRMYAVEFAPDPQTGFAPIASGIQATPTQNTHTNFAAGINGSYRVRVEAGCP